jgi:uncharacterized protein DUF4062
MSKKRYQVFLSSTYTDLIEERREAFQTLLKMQCIPAGMEWFPAQTEEQWAVIKRVIDDCDFYVLIIGGRYGSVTAEGLSYTEKEFDYAVSRVPVLVFPHENPLEIPLGKSEQNELLKPHLRAFRDKAMNGRTVDFWTNSKQLAGQIAVAVSMAITTHDAIGWVRGNEVASDEAMVDLNRLNKKIEDLTEINGQLEGQLAATRVTIPNLAGLDEVTLLSGTYGTYGEYTWTLKVTWREIFAAIAPFLLQPQLESSLRSRLESSLGEKAEGGRQLHNLSMNTQQFQTVKVQLLALKLVFVDVVGLSALSSFSTWHLTPQGEKLMFEERTVKTSNS